jgi:hypothetical protein
MQILEITGMGENRQRREGRVYWESSVLGGRRRARAALGSSGHEGQEQESGWAEKGLFERRKAEKQRSRDEDRRALESGQKSREQLRRENALFAGMKVRIDLDRAKALS